jgi:hypothetical protein
MENRGVIMHLSESNEPLYTKRDGEERLSPPGPQIDVELIKTVQLNGESFDLGSDWHLPVDQDCTAVLRQNLRANKGSEILICLGDTFNTPEGQDSSESINSFLEMASLEYSLVAFVPGNHDLRGRESPYDTIITPDGSYKPSEFDPLVLNTEKNRILLGNIFYDRKFIDPALVDIDEDDLTEFYATLNDGQHLFGGELSHFPNMTEQVARALTSDVDILLTHALPHPSLVTFRVAQMTDEIERLGREQGLVFIHDPVEDAQQAERWDTTPDAFRKWWNMKSFYMGSDVLNHPESQAKDGLVCLYGHNHRSAEKTVRLRSGEEVRLISHQTPLKE